MTGQLPPVEMLSEWSETPRRRKPSWWEKFHTAFRGVKKGIRGHSSFFVHFFFATLAVAGAIALDCDLIEWCLIILCIGGVLTAELFNSALETMFKGLGEGAQARWYPCLDIAAGAVLVASLTAFLVGAIIFINRFSIMLSINR